MKVFVSTQRKRIASAIALSFTCIYQRDNVNAKNMINQTQSYVKTIILKLTMMFA